MYSKGLLLRVEREVVEEKGKGREGERQREGWAYEKCES